MQTIIPVILCGGSGTRLWPVSRDAYPKQFHKFVGDNTLFEDTVLRAAALASVGAVTEIAVVCNEQHRFLAASQALRVTDVPFNITLEPLARNTAAAIAAVAHQYSNIENAIMVVLPSDHYLPDLEDFILAVSVAAKAAAQGKLCAFGIVPTSPETGYGYIESGAPMADVAGAFELKKFVEKPSAERANELLASGRYTWNSGMFVMQVGTFLSELKNYAPDVFAATEQAVLHATRETSFTRLNQAAFEVCPSISIDYAVFEKTQCAAVVPFQGQWSDLGSWSAVAELAKLMQKTAEPSDDCTHVQVQSSGNHIHASKPVALVGVNDLVVVDTTDALLITHKASTQQVKDALALLKIHQPQLASIHRKVQRPWGWYDSIDMGARFQVKRILVSPGASLSLQMHHHRAEHWIVVSGTAEVTNGDKVMLLTENQSTYIPLGQTHRLSNPGKVPLEIIEVQSGSYLGEDDIVRFDDNYGRSAKMNEATIK
jgi:mannose-1-phosphate guanylyltransferase / mannose-6-phosphate isomerase